MIANMKREIAMGKSSYSSRATTSSRNSCEYISSSRRDCSIISISRVNRATPRPVTRFSRHRSACTLCQEEGRRTMRRHSKRTKGGGERRGECDRPQPSRGKGIAPQEGKQKEESHRSRESRSLQKEEEGVLVRGLRR